MDTKKIDNPDLIGIPFSERIMLNPDAPMALSVMRNDREGKLIFDRGFGTTPVSILYEYFNEMIYLLDDLESQWGSYHVKGKHHYKGAMANVVVAYYGVGDTSEDADYLAVTNAEVYDLFHAVGYHVAEIAKDARCEKMATRILHPNRPGIPAVTMSNKVKSVMRGENVSLDLVDEHKFVVADDKPFFSRWGGIIEHDIYVGDEFYKKNEDGTPGEKCTLVNIKELFESPDSGGNRIGYEFEMTDVLGKPSIVSGADFQDQYFGMGKTELKSVPGNAINVGEVYQVVRERESSKMGDTAKVVRILDGFGCISGGINDGCRIEVEYADGSRRLKKHSGFLDNYKIIETVAHKDASVSDAPKGTAAGVARSVIPPDDHDVSLGR